MLRKFLIANSIGCFEVAKPTTDLRFDKCTLIYGENGRGKSTISDALRSLTQSAPEILIGRKTLASGGNQKLVFQFDEGRSVFENGNWTGHQAQVIIYDSTFVNDNVYSGDVVSANHLKKQYGLVVGSKGVNLVREIIARDEENFGLNKEIRTLESELLGMLRGMGLGNLKLPDFEALKLPGNIDAAFKKKDMEVRRVQRAKELTAASILAPYPEPSEGNLFSKALSRTIDNISSDALAAVRTHVSKHDCDDKNADSLESWLETGLSFRSDSSCPFCGQDLIDRTLIEAYNRFFSDAYKNLADQISKLRMTCSRYANGEFRSAVLKEYKSNEKLAKYWTEAAGLVTLETTAPDEIVDEVEAAANALDKALADKQANLIEGFDAGTLNILIQNWEASRSKMGELNSPMVVFNTTIEKTKAGLDASRLPLLQNELAMINAAKKRHESEISEQIALLSTKRDRKKQIATEKSELRNELTAHGKAITNRLGGDINAYLGRLNAGFRINYQEPDYRSKEPTASYQIMINGVPIAPRSKDEATNTPSFRNTLSSGDKSVLALALFLAQTNADPEIKNKIVVLDDPFTSLDGFRRQFTAIEIRRLCTKADQVIILSHDKNFLRLLWDKIDQMIISSCSLQSGAPGITTIAQFDIEDATRPRHVTERMEIEEYLEGEPHKEAYIRTRLRTVCEDFYRRGDPSLFGDAATLDQIIRALNTADAAHPYKGALECLRDINQYSRGDNHAAIDGDPYQETNEDELKGFCKTVLDLTQGM